MMKTIGIGFLMLAAGALVMLCATTGSVMLAQTPGTERSHVGEVIVGKQPETVVQSLNQPTANKQKVVEIGEKNDTQTVAVSAGDKIEIRLPSNISTGYGWRVESVSAATVRQDGGVTYINPPVAPNSRPVVGRGGENLVKFDAVSPGKVTIKMEYTRPWEKNKPPAKTFTITLDVK